MQKSYKITSKRVVKNKTSHELFLFCYKEDKGMEWYHSWQLQMYFAVNRYH
jgi:hypothetical protein